MIRDYSSEDHGRVTELGKELSLTFDSEKANELEKIIVYEEENEIFGFALYSQLYEVVDLLYIVVSKDRRRSGIGHKMVDYIVDKTKADKIILEVRSTNEEAVKFYESLGFRKVRVIKNYYEGKDDAFSMERTIL